MSSETLKAKAQLIGKSLAVVRKEKGHTQEDMARFMGKTQKAISDIESGNAFSSVSIDDYMEILEINKVIFLTNHDIDLSA